MGNQFVCDIDLRHGGNEAYDHGSAARYVVDQVY